ncbi:AMIN domain-containing protein [Rhodobacterales bacterium HKCCE2091]|nr:AMIN domain-containing protein [Rhodobacterales bacterium HKCCE2091]
MRRAEFLLFFALLVVFAPASATAQEFRALARVENGAMTDNPRRGTEIFLDLSQAVPFRVYTIDGPPRLVIDLSEVTWEGLPEDFDDAASVTAVATGAAGERAGWSRMVLTLDGYHEVNAAAMETNPEDGSARILVQLFPTDAEGFAAAAEPAPAVTAAAPGIVERDGPLVIVLDPGHGGVDPGAEAGGEREADLMLLFARELRDLLRRSGRVEVVLTREGDDFVPLPERVSIARAAGADAFISLHADALAEGRATGATVYTLSADASDAASAALAERFDRADLLQGVDLSGSDDAVAGVLMDLARLETDPRSDALADRMVEGIAAATGNLHRHPRLEAGFTVLKAADIPSVLVEVGFLSDPDDRDRLLDPAWRAEMQAALRDAILDWAETDATRATLLRQ